MTVEADDSVRISGRIVGLSDEGFLKVRVGENIYETYPADAYSLDTKNNRIIRKLS